MAGAHGDKDSPRARRRILTTPRSAYVQRSFQARYLGGLGRIHAAASERRESPRPAENVRAAQVLEAEGQGWRVELVGQFLSYQLRYRLNRRRQELTVAFPRRLISELGGFAPRRLASQSPFGAALFSPCPHPCAVVSTRCVLPPPPPDRAVLTWGRTFSETPSGTGITYVASVLASCGRRFSSHPASARVSSTIPRGETPRQGEPGRVA